METVLNAKHWQVLLMTYLPMTLLKILAHLDTNLAILSDLGGAWVVLCRSIWFSFVGYFAYKQIPSHSKAQFWLFIIALLTQAFSIILPVLVVELYFLAPNKLSEIPFDLINQRIQYPYALGLFYCFYFVAKYLTSAEKNTLVPFGESVPTFLWLVFFPIGIFVIQPRVNTLYNNHRLQPQNRVQL